jgi:hypothetical protein
MTVKQMPAMRKEFKDEKESEHLLTFSITGARAT